MQARATEARSLEAAEQMLRFEIEEILNIHDRGTFALVRVVSSDSAFQLTSDAKLGGCPIAQWCDIPRKIDSDGKPRFDVFVFKLKYPEDTSRLRKGQEVLLEP